MRLKYSGAETSVGLPAPSVSTPPGRVFSQGILSQQRFRSGLLGEPAEFATDEVVIDALAAQQGVRRPVLDELTSLQHENAVEVAERREAISPTSPTRADFCDFRRAFRRQAIVYPDSLRIRE